MWRANLQLRGATRVLARVGSFMAFHLAQLDKRARKFPWETVFHKGVPLRVEVTCKASKIYHAKAAAQRIEAGIAACLGPVISAEAEIVLKVRIEDNRVTFSVDTSGPSLHKRGHKEAVGKAPLRETMAALFLRQAGYDGTQSVVDPMCGSGTFVIEAAEWARGLAPGRARGFAFEHLASFDAAAWEAMREPDAPADVSARFYGSDRDAGAVRNATANAARAGVEDLCSFACHGASETARPDGPPGLVMVNPPYGGRIGNKKLLFPLYGSLGQVLKERFKGWKVGVVTSEPGLAKAAGLSFLPDSPPVPHGGMKVRFYRTDALT